jgi:hypothetical protein
MTILARAALATLFTLVAASRLDAQSRISVTIGGGPHAGTYEMSDQCDVTPDKFPSLFIVASRVGTVPPNAPTKIEFFSAPGKGKPDGFVVSVHFRGKPGERIAYDLNAIPPELKPPIPLPPLGRGTVTIKKTATGTTATFRGVTHDGVKMEGSVDCRSGAS